MGNTQKQAPNYFETFYKQDTFKICILCNSMNKEFNNDFYILGLTGIDEADEDKSNIDRYIIDLRCSKGHLIKCHVCCSDKNKTFWTIKECINEIKSNSSYYKKSIPSAPPIVEAKAILDDK
jgi:hypothetical protein